ncbi:recombinase family protein [Bradyrhizobium sp. 177]|nr:recombinase family protein [Bradyrhizobium sp. 177]
MRRPRNEHKANCRLREGLDCATRRGRNRRDPTNSASRFRSSARLSHLKEYIDDGWSGDILARPSLDQLRHDARGNTWQAVLVYDPDRLARRYSYQELVMDELREALRRIGNESPINAPR